ncbi:hypothetical protein G3I42_15530, partial [Streptomyces sp. SID11385]|nr:hypothetical protein [Streptomyces sp. SID11385]
MTDTVAPPEVTEAAPPPEQATPTSTPVTESAGEHTPGGWPVVPLAFSGANTAVSTVAAASLAGGPVGLAVAATGLAALGVAASRAASR